MENQTIIIVVVIILLIACYYITTREKVENMSSNMSSPQNKEHEIIIFLNTKSCGHCKVFKDNKLNNLKNDISTTNNKLVIYDLVTEEYPAKRAIAEKLMSKYDINYIPASIISNDKTSKQLNGEITFNNILNTIKSM